MMSPHACPSAPNPGDGLADGDAGDARVAPGEGRSDRAGVVHGASDVCTGG